MKADVVVKKRPRDLRNLVATLAEMAVPKGGASSGGSAGSPPMVDAGTKPDAAPDTGAPPVVRERFDWIGIVGTGQSLSVGAEGSPLLQTTQPFGHLKLSMGTSLNVPPFDWEAPEISLVPLVEPIRRLSQIYPGAYPSNIYGETPHTAMANQLSAIHQQKGAGDLVTVHTVVGESGQGIDMLGKSAVFKGGMGAAFAATLFEVKAITRLAKAKGKSYGVAAIVLTHGESDWNNPTYEAKVLALWRDYNTDLKAITGQKSSIPIVLTQQQAVPSGKGVRPLSALVAWRLSVDHPGDIICAGPRYQYTYAKDRTHFPSDQYVRLGEKYAQAFYQSYFTNKPWRPLEPTAVLRNDDGIVVQFHVPVPPMTWDEAIAPPHQSVFTEWKSGRGFEIEDSSGRVEIKSVVLSATSVQVQTARPIAAGKAVVRYAQTADGVVSPTQNSDCRGQVRDSDTFAGRQFSTAHRNYAVGFELPIP